MELPGITQPVSQLAAQQSHIAANRLTVVLFERIPPWLTMAIAISSKTLKATSKASPGFISFAKRARSRPPVVARSIESSTPSRRNHVAAWGWKENNERGVETWCVERDLGQFSTSR